MKKNIKLTKPTIFKIISLLSIFSLSITAMIFIINACLNQNIILAWILFGIMTFCFIMFLIGVIGYLKTDYERIKAYFKKIIN